MRRIFPTVFLLGSLACGHKEQQLSFISFRPPEKVDSMMAKNSHLQYFIIRGYSDNRESLNQVDSFADKIKSADYADYPQYELIFYKESGQTNVGNIAKNPRVIDRYSQDNDLVLTYTWSRGKFISRQRIKNGMPEEGTDKIEVKDLPK
jgi:hypothetical protein